MFLLDSLCEPTAQLFQLCTVEFRYGEKPGPVKLPKDKLLTALGYRTVEVIPGQNTKLS
jgi:hypothetical protein